MLSRRLPVALVIVVALASPAAAQLASRPAEEWVKTLDAPDRVKSMKIDEVVAALDMIVIGSGIRGSKLALPGESAANLPNAEILALALSSTN